MKKGEPSRKELGGPDGVLWAVAQASKDGNSMRW